MKLMRASVATVAMLGSINPALGGATPDFDFQWAVIGSVGNAPYLVEPLSSAYNRGSVGYEYRISRLEITTAQWLEFRNTFTTQSFELRRFAEPGFWAGEFDPDYLGPGERYRLRSDVPDAANAAVQISWRDAARYCNWLHNEKSSSLNAITNGAYDTSTFGETQDGLITDQVTHSPGAKFWIPTLDERLKAVFFDPRGDTGDSDQWWSYPYASDSPPVPGWPGTPGAQTNAGLQITEINNPQWIPLGSYPDAQTPWGLLEASGGSSEWTEAIVSGRWRRISGSAGGSAGFAVSDRIGGPGASLPDAPFATLRVVSAIPAPSSSLVGLLSLSVLINRRRA